MNELKLHLYSAFQTENVQWICPSYWNQASQKIHPKVNVVLREIASNPRTLYKYLQASVYILNVMVFDSDLKDLKGGRVARGAEMNLAV